MTSGISEASAHGCGVTNEAGKELLGFFSIQQKTMQYMVPEEGDTQ